MAGSARKVTRMQLRRPTRADSGHEEDWIALTADSLHDLGSPVNQICTLSDLIFNKHRGALDEETLALLGYLHTSANRLQNLLGGLRTYMRVAGPPPACCRSDGNMLLAGALAMLQHAIAESNATVTHDALPELWCDPSHITYALASLIENAIKFRAEASPEIHIGAFPEKETWVLSVHDNGLGIDPRYADRIFGAFKRIHNDLYPGPGVGLAITKRLIERHGGQIWVESELGRGATFFVRLPKMDQRRVKPSAEQAVA